LSNLFKAACIQVTSGPDIAANLEVAESYIAAAVGGGATFVCLPENVAMMEPDRAKIVERAEPESTHSALLAFKNMAQRNQTWISVGSLTVSTGKSKAANRSYLLDPHGNITAQYDKIHMFDVDLANGESYRESDTFEPGHNMVVTDLPWGRLGLTICYDLRFPSLYRKLAKNGAQFITVPSAFTRQTGTAHWHVLLRARAIETGCYVFAAAQCGDHEGGRQTYGYSLIISPWGEILAEGGEAPGTIVADIDPGAVAEARSRIPSLTTDVNFN